MSFRRLMNQTFQVYRLEMVYDDQGGYKEQENYSHDIKGRISPASATERRVADQLGAEITHNVYCMSDQDIQRGDTLRFDGREVKVVDVQPTSNSHHLQCTAREVQHSG